MPLRSFTLRNLIEHNAAVHGREIAFIAGSQQTTYEEYAKRCTRMAAGLAACAVKPGDRIAILAHNCQEFADALGAAAYLGAILVPVNWRLSALEVAHILKDTTPSVLIVSEGLQALIPQAISSLQLFSVGKVIGFECRPVSELYREAHDAMPAAINDDAGLLILHTAAVQGYSRGALLSHRGLLTAAFHLQTAWKLDSEDAYLGALPLFHLAGIGTMLSTLLAGGKTMLLPGFDPAEIVRLIDEGLGTVMGSFPPMLTTVLEAAEKSGSRLSKLKIVSGIDTPQTIEKFSAWCQSTEFWVAYGQTETSGAISMGRYSDCPGSAGKVVPLHTVSLVDVHEKPVPSGSVGEILVRGPLVFKGYWNLEHDNAMTFVDDWHHTGDLGRLDLNGNLWYAGRAPSKQLIKPGGENVYPAEVERVLLSHPAVAEAVVFGVADEQWGEAIKAVCLLHSGQVVSAEVLTEFVGQRIARYKKPKYIVFASSLPRTPSGTIDREAAKRAGTLN